MYKYFYNINKFYVNTKNRDTEKHELQVKSYEFRVKSLKAQV